MIKLKRFKELALLTTDGFYWTYNLFSMLEWKDDLRIRNTPLYLDSRQPRPLCFISHAHSDHIGSHDRSIATPETAALASYRIGLENCTRVGCSDYVQLEDAACHLRLLSAGHVLGSAMLHVTTNDGTLLYTGDFKLRQSLTVPVAQPVPADVLVMESTYGRPFFQFPPWQTVAEQLVDLTTQALRDGRQPIVIAYSLGKAQEGLRILTRAGINVTLHGAPFAISRIYNDHGVDLGPYRRYRYEDFHGPAAIDLHERGVLIAPPHATRTGFVTRFSNPCRIVLTGWALLKNAQYRYGVDHALPLSDHADFKELLELIERVSPRKIYTHHGYREFADDLRRRGLDAECARPDAQLSLF